MMLIHMLCCDKWYADVQASMNHTCDIVEVYSEDEVREFKKLEKLAQRYADIKFTYNNLDGRAFNSTVTSVKKALDDVKAEYDAMWDSMGMKKLRRFGNWQKG